MEVPPAKPSAPALPSAFVVATGVSSDEDEDVEMELQKPLASANGPLSGVVKLTRQPHCVLWPSATDEDDDEVLPPQTLPAATKAINPDIAEGRLRSQLWIRFPSKDGLDHSSGEEPRFSAATIFVLASFFFCAPPSTLVVVLDRPLVFSV
ncbi:hypothetical protein ZWY2020_040088 [Hordeum vulgare]|nr:hypothetical protein ZWY2020_040088 [Hordeum vulgare]